MLLLHGRGPAPNVLNACKGIHRTYRRLTWVRAFSTLDRPHHQRFSLTLWPCNVEPRGSPSWDE
jgi:hypothetical protein